MKKLQIVWIVLFFLLLMLPVVFFEWEENVVSEIDNRQLTNNPFGENATEGADLTTQLEQYVQDRIGFRDQMISGYTQLNDKLFHKMIHPLYEYGKDGYIFSRQKENVELGEVHRDFAEMLAQIQQYCQQRGVLFLFVLDPEKAAIYPDELRDGIHYDNSWVQEFGHCWRRRVCAIWTTPSCFGTRESRASRCSIGSTMPDTGTTSGHFTG